MGFSFKQKHLVILLAFASVCLDALMFYFGFYADNISKIDKGLCAFDFMLVVMAQLALLFGYGYFEVYVKKESTYLQEIRNYFVSFKK